MHAVCDMCFGACATFSTRLGPAWNHMPDPVPTVPPVAHPGCKKYMPQCLLCMDRALCGAQTPDWPEQVLLVLDLVWVGRAWGPDPTHRAGPVLFTQPLDWSCASHMPHGPDEFDTPELAQSKAICFVIQTDPSLSIRYSFNFTL